MTIIVLTVLLAIMQTSSPVPRKTANSTDGAAQNVKKDANNNQGPAEIPPTAVNHVTPEPEKTPSSSPSSKDAEQSISVSKLPAVSVDRDWADWVLWGFNGLLVIAGFLGIRVAYKTLKTIERQARSTHHQAVQVRKQTHILGKSAEAAQKAAEATLLTAQAAIASARPLVSCFGTYSSSGIFTFKAANFGNAPAEVVSYASGLILVDRVENLPIPPSYGADQIPPLALLIPSRMSDESNITVGIYNTQSIPAPDPKKQRIAFFFKVIYQNPLINHPLIPQYESRMCFWCDRNGGIPQAGGPREYNKHT